MLDLVQNPPESQTKTWKYMCQEKPRSGIGSYLRNEVPAAIEQCWEKGPWL